jgi:hypothetical protein
MMTNPADLIRRTDDIRERYGHYWRDEQAQAELKALWGDAINDCGVFTDCPEEVLYDRDRCKASISIGGANGLFAFGSTYWTPTEGYSAAPSVLGELFDSHDAARTAAIKHLLQRIPSTDTHEQRQQVGRMQQAVSELLRQPSLF